MGRQAVVALYVLVMAAVVVLVDVFFLKHQFGARLATNIGIVAVFIAGYFIFLRRQPRP